jgi:S-adenosylmethionine-dependent methyltransferase
MQTTNYHPSDIRNLFDKIAAQEDQLEKRHFLRNEIPREFIKKYLKPDDVVLDAGGGTGINAIMMAQLCQWVTLLDISPGMLKLAAANIRETGLTERIEIREGDITNLNQMEEDSFSFVVCVGGALSHALEKGRQAVRELTRVAKQGAVLIIGCESKYGLMRHYFRYEDDLIDEVSDMFSTSEFLNNGEVRAHLYTVTEMMGLIKEAGCEIMEVASTPTIINSLDESKYHDEERWAKLKALELAACTTPELLGIGSHLLCVARKI